jgi:beta-lactam-binding protein with PASTA domain
MDKSKSVNEMMVDNIIKYINKQFFENNIHEIKISDLPHYDVQYSALNLLEKEGIIIRIKKDNDDYIKPGKVVSRNKLINTILK